MLYGMKPASEKNSDFYIREWRVIDYSLVSPDLWTVWSKTGF
jgi:hypothetical protein